MSDPPQQTSRHDFGEEQLLRLVPEHELDRLRARQEHLTETVESLEAENRMLRVEIAALERKLEQKDSQRQQVVDNYERILAKKDGGRETDTVEAESGRTWLIGVLFGRSDSE
ncbi:hypothetical protein [Halovenus sp. HT40]|uniref:hypothetical protein n=1 Tax=Halovenus sp. HT40 TaxID=3126691 RepID=UPI00300F74C5